MLVSALPHDQADAASSPHQPEGRGTDIPVVHAAIEILPERDFSDVVARDDAAFNSHTLKNLKAVED